jgi:superfamily II DNA or RNA helicase
MGEYYKSYKDKNYGDILKKYEFRQSKKSKSVYQESIQLILKNYISKFTPYDNILLYHDVGVGKTCSAITIAEGFKDYVTKMNKRILVLVKNQNIEKNFINELLSDCTMGYYSVISEEEQNKLRRFINKNYNILTYGTFVNRVLGAKVATTGAKKGYIRKESQNPITNLNNTIIIIDEVHNVTNNDTYKALYKVLSTSFNYRLVLLTATPMYDNPKEIVEISNLLNIKEPNNILPIRNALLDKKSKNPIMYTEDVDYLKLKTPITHITEYGSEQLINALKGKISYISANIETNPQKIEMGKPLLNKVGSKNVIYCEMSDYQYNIYKKALKLDLHETLQNGNNIEKILADENMNDNIDENPDTLKSSSLYKNCSDASTMSYPNDSFGAEGFNLLKDDKSILKLPELKKYSNKLATLLTNIQKSVGNIFIYSNYVSNGGINLVKEILLQNGYKRYSPKINQQNAFIIFDEQLQAEKRDKLRKIFNSKENKNGDIIKIILGSPIISEGITLKNVRQVHILEPTWNMSKTNQIIGRAVRNYSHKDLPDEDRNVEIYKYMSIYSKDPNGMFIDKEKYILSEEKDRSNKEVERLLKRISFDCFIHKERNDSYYKKFTDNSAECDYKECALECMIVPRGNPDELSKVTYDINIKNFEEYTINYIKNQIRDLFELYFIWKLDDIIDHIKTIDQTISLEVIYTSLDDIVTNKSIMLDKYGREGYIINKGEYYIFNPTNIDIDSSIYSKIFDFSIYTNNIPLVTYLEKTKGIKGTKESPQKKEKAGKLEKQTVELSKADIDFNNNIKKKYKIYGTYKNKENINDNKFRIVDTRLLTTEELEDQRKKITGKVCSSFANDELKNITIALGITNSDIKEILELKDKDDNFVDKIKNKEFCKLLNIYLQRKERILK